MQWIKCSVQFTYTPKNPSWYHQLKFWSEWMSPNQICGLLLLLLMVVLVAAGPREARGDTPNLLISSHNDNMLLSADGEQTVIGPGKLRVTGKLKLRPPCGRYSRLRERLCERDWRQRRRSPFIFIYTFLRLFQGRKINAFPFYGTVKMR